MADLYVEPAGGCPWSDCHGDGTANDHDGVLYCIDCGRPTA